MIHKMLYSFNIKTLISNANTKKYLNYSVLYIKLLTYAEMKKLIVGLGNVGSKYKGTRHNLGFDAVEAIASKFNISKFENKFDGKIAKIYIANEEIIFFIPMLFMNNAGIPVNKVVNFYKISSNNIFIIFDDLDLKLGTIKIKIGGGNGGHNGLKSIDCYVSKVYNKIKVGISRPPMTSMIAEYVLGRFNINEYNKIDIIFHFLAHHFHLILNRKYEKFLTLYSLENLRD